MNKEAGRSIGWLDPAECAAHRPHARESQDDWDQVVKEMSRPHKYLGGDSIWSQTAIRGYKRRSVKRHDKEAFGVRGPFGLSYAYNARYVPGCWYPELMDVPIVSAIIAARKALRKCKNWRYCTKSDLREAWAGMGKCAERQRADGTCAPMTLTKKMK